MSQPLISVLMPIFNGEAYLENAIQSVLDQSFSEFEFLILDDGSSDRSMEIVKSFSDPRIRILGHETHRGLFGNLNQLIKASQAPLLHIFCQDDILEPNCLEEELSFFHRYTEIGMSYCKSQSLDSEGKLTLREIERDLPEVVYPDLSLQHFFYHGCIPGNLSTVCVRKVCIEGAGYFDEDLRLSGDYELWARICSDWPLGVIHQNLVQLRSHSRRLSALPDSGTTFIEENSHVRKLLIPLLPRSRQAFARAFEIKRHRVFDFHYGVRCLLARRFQEAFRVLTLLTPYELFMSFWYWGVTMNNRLYRPQAKWILPDTEESESLPEPERKTA